MLSRLVQLLRNGVLLPRSCDGFPVCKTWLKLRATDCCFVLFCHFKDSWSEALRKSLLRYKLFEIETEEHIFL